MNAILRLAMTVVFATAVPTAAFAQAAPTADAHQHDEPAAPAGQNAPEQGAPEQPAGDESACPCPDCKKMMQMMMEHMRHTGAQAQPSHDHESLPRGQ